ncbi:beta-ketoacyl synthase N-terminal-like domain-containing protein [Actinoplanes sp. NPDC049802]|uniref:beta-ketoacyl synthase N-terminal-like domain-containing protein n=1 Tax=Actinoplanes sp. NPDC049802 TaxID=3154742 RepID=UPI0033D51CBC
MEPVAVVGMAVLFPGAPDLDTYWHNIVTGADSITGPPPGYGLPPESRGGFLGDLATVDPAALGVMPAALPLTEPDQLIALHVAAAALADAGIGAGTADPGRVGVILGRGGYLTPALSRFGQRVRGADQLTHTLTELLPELGAAATDRIREAFADRLGPVSPGAEIGLVPNLAAARIAHRHGFGGPAYTVDGACASSLLAVDQAVAELARGRCDVVLAGGVHHAHDVTLWSVFAGLGAVSPTGRSRPFTGGADGLVIGEGSGIVVLKRLTDARRDGDRVYAVIRGTGVSGDAGAASLMNPVSAGQAAALRQAWSSAGLDPTAPDAVGLIEAHGTATAAGDACELATLHDVFGTGGQAVLGSVKALIGHTMPAAGIAGLIKAALAVHHGVLPPMPACDDPHPGLAATRFRPIPVARAWFGATRRAAVNAFGFGGVNAHAVLEQAPAAGRPARVREPVAVLRLAADTTGELAELLDRPPAVPSGHGRMRLAVVAPTERTLAAARRVVAAGRPWRGRQDIWFSPRPLLAGGDGRIAFLYPGLEAECEPRAGDVAARIGRDVTLPGADGLHRQGVTVYRTSRLLDTALRDQGVRPDVLAGHSLGEWTAMAVAAGYHDEELERVLEAFADAVRQVPDVVFAAVGAAAETVAPFLTGTAVTVSHDNAPHQSVVCGPSGEIEKLLAGLAENGVVGQPLPFRSGFHTPLLRPYVHRLTAAAGLLDTRPWRTPLWSATTLAPYPDDDGRIRDLFVRHLLEPVRFRGLIERLHAAGVRAFVQVGPGGLGSLVHDILRGHDHLAIAATTPRQTGLGQLTRVLAALWAEGAAIGGDLLPARNPRPPSAGRVRLDLGAPLVTLGEAGAGLLPRSGVPETGPVSESLTGALGAETARAAEEVVAACRRRAAPATTTVRRHLSLDRLPYLRDHTFAQLPAGWPEPGDGFPVVPATDLIRQLCDAARPTASGVVTAVHDAGFDRWLAVAPPVTVTFEIAADTPARRRVTARGYARATVEFGGAYPPAPPVWPRPTDTGWAPRLTAAQMYAARWMFHGPAYQGVTGIDEIGARHVRGTLTTPAGGGALLDSAAQLVGYWMTEQLDGDNRAFPVALTALRLYGPDPAPGERLTCHVRIGDVTAGAVTADLQLVHDGTVRAEMRGWRLRRFAGDDAVRAVDRTPGTARLARRHEAGWHWVTTHWTDQASRDLLARTYLTPAEWALYQRRPARGRDAWLLGRIALKDAVRTMLPDPEVFPIELDTGNDTAGRPWITGRHGRHLPPLAVSIAHHGALGVALARPAGPVGIDVLEVADRDDATVAAALAPAERDLLGADRATWFTRFFAAKEAAGKALGTGLGGDPRTLRVTAASDTAITVATTAGDFRVRLTDLHHEGRRHVVAWTTDREVLP